MFALFNNQKQFVGYSEQIPASIKYYKELDINFDPTKKIWDGDYDTGYVKNLNDTKISEFELEKDFIKKIKSLYNTEISHMLTIRQIGLISKHLNLFDPQFKEMWEELSPLFKQYDKFIDFLKKENNIKYKEEIYENNKKIFTRL
jgi:hypothetical protein